MNGNQFPLQQMRRPVPDDSRKGRRPKAFLRRSRKSQLKRGFSEKLPCDPRLPFLWLRRRGLAERLARLLIAAAITGAIAPLVILFEIAVGSDLGPHPDAHFLAPSMVIAVGIFVNALVLSNALTKADFSGWVENDDDARPHDPLGNRLAGYWYSLSGHEDPIKYRDHVATAVVFGTVWILVGLFLMFGVRY